MIRSALLMMISYTSSAIKEAFWPFLGFTCLCMISTTSVKTFLVFLCRLLTAMRAARVE